jgi:Predicted GTPase
MSVLRSADLLLFLVDVFEPEQYSMLRGELHGNGIRMDTSPPDVHIQRRDRGGVDVRKTDEVSLSDDVIEGTLREHGIVNAVVVVREDISVEELSDAILDNRVYIDSMVAVNKVDLADESVLERTRDVLAEEGVDSAVGVSAEEKRGLGALKDRIFEELDLTRVYLKPQGGDPDYDEPLVFGGDATVGDAAEKIHRAFDGRFRYAKLWGESAKHDGQQVGEDHELADGDVLTVITS